MKKEKELVVHRILNDMNIRKKLIVLYAVCIILPLFLVNGLFLFSLARAERKEQEKNLEQVSERIEAGIKRLVSDAENKTNKISMNRKISQFLETSFASELTYYTNHQKLFYDSFFDEGFLNSYSKVTMFADNPTIVNGGLVRKLDQSEQWYRSWKNTGRDASVCYYYTGEENGQPLGEKKFSFIRKISFYSTDSVEKFVRVDISYSYLEKYLASLCSDDLPVYICSNRKILYSNQKDAGFYTDFELLDESVAPLYRHEFTINGTAFQAIFMDLDESLIVTMLRKNARVLLFLLVVSLLVPFILLYFINRSFTVRLREVIRAFHGTEGKGTLVEVAHVRGKDEIGYLMESYNHLVREHNHLIRTVYENRLHRQDMEIGKQNAELLALRMQVNPHFLFNMLESIRMSSLLNHESRTAEMIERLAVLERQAVDWDSDFETIENEISFVKNYLELQKFRFGDRFSYTLDVDDDCLKLRVPKMTILTFVENACVHGTDKKLTETMVFINVRKRDEKMAEIEIEDTSGGMSEEKVKKLREQMENCTMDMLRESKHTGVLNACLRLKMMSGDQVEFDLESEEGVGTYLVIAIPIEKM